MAHVWPTDDSFTAGSTAFGDWPSAYLKAGFWSGKTIAHPVSGNYSSTINAADLGDPYSTVAGFESSEVTPSSDPAGYLWRPLSSSADGVVTMAFSYRALVGGPLEEQVFSTAFVAARVTGSTYTSATNSHTAWQDGYYFGFLNSGALFASWYLIRANAGTLTVLYSARFGGLWRVTSEFPEARGELELSVADEAGDVRLIGRIRRATAASEDAAVPGTPPLETVEVISYLDNSGSKLTAAGRYGFALNGQRAVGGGNVAPLCTMFQVVEGATTRVRDEWQRSIRQAGLAVSATVGGTTYTGRTMLCSWAGDFHGVAPFDQKLWRSKVGGLTDRLNIKPDTEPTGTGTGSGGFMHSLRRATDRRSQNRSCTFRFSSLQQDGTAGTTDPSAPRNAGITLRASQTLAPSTTTIPVLGYTAYVSRNDAAGTSACKVYRWRSGVSTELATATVTANLNTDYVLRFDCYNQLDAAGDNVGACVLRVFWGGAQVVLTQVDTSIEVTAAGTIIDGTSQRIVEGSLEGLYLWTPDGDKTTFASAWSESTLTNATGTAPAAQASIAVAGETDDDTSQTFVTPYNWGVEEIQGRIAYVTQLESGHRRAGHAHTRERRRWRISASAITATERTALIAFWDAHRGCERTFSWTPPYASSAIKAHFVDESLGHRLADRGVYAYAIEIEERFA